MEFEVGKSYKFLPRGTNGERKCHILALIDEHMIVYKYYDKHWQRWFYCIESDAVINAKFGAIY